MLFRSQERILDIFRSFRAANPSLRVDIVRCRKWLHYTGVFSLGLTAAKTGDVFFLSNDMIMTPSFLRAVAEVADAVPDAGIVRGTSPYVDSHPEHTVKTQAPLRSIQDIDAFAEAIYRENGAKYAVDQLLSGDAVLVRRALIDAIGVLDTRFFGYFGDVDYGLRARRAGFRLVCAKGAWLYHFGEGHVRQEVKDGGVNLIDARNRRLQLVRQAGAALLDKWGVDLKAHFHGKSTVSLSFQEHVDLVSASGSAPLRFDLSDDFWRDVEFA